MRLRIAQIAPVATTVPPPRSGSIELMTSLLTEGLVARGHDVTLFATGDSKTSAKLHAICSHGYRDNGEMYPWELYEMLNVAAAVERAGDFDILHYQAEWYPVSLAFTRISRTPLLQTLHYAPRGPEVALWRYYPEALFTAISHAQARLLEGFNVVGVVLHGVDTTGFHRLMVKGKNRLGVSLHSRRRMHEFHRRAEERGNALPAAITLGIHPLHYMGSMVYAYPPHVRKFEIIGGLFGEPYRLAKTGVQDIEVPAGAEIIIEGEILAHVREPEGPFSEFTGYASYRSTQNVFVAHRIRMRRDAMYHSIVSGMSQDHILVSCVTREGEILNTLRRNLPNVIAVHVPHRTCGAFLAIVKMKKTAQGEPQQAIMAALGTEFYTKYVIVVDEDVDIFDMNDVMWAVATRVHAEKDIVFIPGCKGAILDPTSDPETFTVTKMGIDATRPSGKDFAERLVISEEQRARVRGILEAAGVKL